MKFFVIFGFFALFLLNCISAAQVVLYFPQNQVIKAGDTIDLGIVGPGQTLKLGVRGESGEFHTITGKEVEWSQLKVERQALPVGWSAVDSLLFASDKIASVVISKDALEGEYVFDLAVFQDANQLQPLKFKAKVFVTKKVFDFLLLRDPVKAEVGKAAVYLFKLKNKSSASEAFHIASNGLPSGMSADFDSPLIAPYSEQLVELKVIANEKGNYKFKISATALSSEKLIESQVFELFVGSNLIGDLKSTTRGALVFPSLEQAVYSLLGLVSLLF